MKLGALHNGKIMTKLIGGEIDFQHDGFHTYLTDSGRSSLRLILQSGFRHKKFLLPDFLCKIIPAVFDELGVSYSYYTVNPDLSINFKSIGERNYDAIYLIDYFGKKQNIRSHPFPDDAWFLEDCVFMPVVDPPNGVQNWVGFNSFRKISHIADGSIVKSSVKLAKDLICRDEPPYSGMKYEAKRVKYEFLHYNKYSEQLYLKLFNEAEALADRQKDIFSISHHSLANLLEFYRNREREYEIRSKNYHVLDRHLGRFNIGLDAEYYTLYVLSVDRRDELRNYLFSHKIFLPVHWPGVADAGNSLYKRIISIPVDSRYDGSDMLRVADLINRFYAGR